MAKTLKRLFGPAQLTAATATKYTVPAGTKAEIRKIEVANPSGAAVDLTMSIGADAAGTRIRDAKSIPADDVHEIWGPIVMDAAEILAAHASVTTTLVMTVYGYEHTLG